MRIKWLKRALANFEAEVEYIGRDNLQAAYDVAQKIYESIQALKDYPAMGRTGRIHGTRELVIPGLPYIVPYRVTSEAVEILRILHTSRKWPKKM